MKKGENKKLFLLTGGTEDFHKTVSNFCPSCVLKSNETLLPGQLDYDEKFSRRFEADNYHINIF